MNKSSSLYFYIIVGICVLSIFCLWFFKHPNSPWHSRNHYWVSFSEIGGLKIRDAVNINGLPNGYVEEFELTDSCVWAKIAVLSKIEIPTDSRIQVINAGLMGERVVNIMIGNSNDYYKDNARIKGVFDLGTTTVGTIAINIIKEANGIANTLADIADTIFSEPKKQHYKRIGTKAKQFGKGTMHILNSAEKSALSSIDSLKFALAHVSGIMEETEETFAQIADNLEMAKHNYKNLSESLEKVKSSVELIAQKLESGDNTASLALSRELHSELRAEMHKISESAEELLQKITRDGLDLNVDFW